jgi:hypothetical protein
VVNRSRRGRGDLVDVRFEPAKKWLVADHAVFHNLREAAPQFPQRQRGQRFDVRHHAPRLPEAAHEVFAGREIDAGFPANRAVDLGHEGGRDLPDRQAPHVGCRHKAGQIADDTAADCHNVGFAIDGSLSQGPPDSRCLSGGLG